MAAVFAAGSMQELNGKRVEVKAATPKGSGPVGRGTAGMATMAGRGMGYGYPPRGIMPGRYPGDYGWAMHPGGQGVRVAGRAWDGTHACGLHCCGLCGGVGTMSICVGTCSDAPRQGWGGVGRGTIGMTGRSMGYGEPPRGMMRGRYPGDYGWAMHQVTAKALGLVWVLGGGGAGPESSLRATWLCAVWAPGVGVGGDEVELRRNGSMGSRPRAAWLCAVWARGMSFCVAVGTDAPR